MRNLSGIKLFYLLEVVLGELISDAEQLAT